jgi:hypothetical protein
MLTPANDDLLLITLKEAIIPPVNKKPQRDWSEEYGRWFLRSKGY